MIGQDNKNENKGQASSNSPDKVILANLTFIGCFYRLVQAEQRRVHGYYGSGKCFGLRGGIEVYNNRK
jgi:hypothetical protein